MSGRSETAWPAREPGPAADGAAGGTGTHRWRSIRFRLLMPIIVAALGLAGLGVAQTVTAVTAATDAGHGRALAQAAAATVRLGHQIEQEVSETDALVARGGKAGAELLTAQRSRTDLVLANYRALVGDARAGTPRLEPMFKAVDRELATLPRLRDTAVNMPNGAKPPEQVYDSLAQALVNLLDALPEELADPHLAASARAVAMLYAVEHIQSVQRELLRNVFLRKGFGPGELQTLAQLYGAANDRLTQFASVAAADVRTRYRAQLSGPDVQAAHTMLVNAINAGSAAGGSGGGGPGGSSLQVDPDSWYIAQSTTLRRLYLVELHAITQLGNDAGHAESVSRTRAALTGLATFLVVLLTLAGAVLLAISIGRRLSRLRGNALNVAAAELPRSVSAVATASSVDTVQELVSSSVDRVDGMLADASDEIGGVGVAIGALHRQALRLAADQATLRMEVAALFVALSRRGQTLIQRQIQVIDDFERAETDPQRLERLFSLDHLAARMRRNEENLLVVAGGEPGRRFTRPVSLFDVIRAAAAEIEDYRRVDLVEVANLNVGAHAVGDLIHLLAELLENATVFSPPGSSVRVSARNTGNEVMITVFDEGIGIPPAQLEEINRRLTEPTLLASDIARTMGLYVVANLAARHDIKVDLHSSQGGGTMATVRLAGGLFTGTTQGGGPADLPGSLGAALKVPRPRQPSAVLAGPSGGHPAVAAGAPTLALPAGVVNALTLPAAQTAGYTVTGDGAPPSGDPGQPAPAGHAAAVGNGRDGRRRPPTPSGPGVGTGRNGETGPDGGARRPDGRGSARDQTVSFPALTAAGLPRRREGAEVTPLVDPATLKQAGAPDPELIRARLAGLAGGIAAARRQLNRQQPT